MSTRVARRTLGCAALALLAAALPVAASKKMFVTSAVGTGDLGSWPQAGGHVGRLAGDYICRTLAADAGLADANLFRAWLSTSSVDAYCYVTGYPAKKADNCNQPSLPDAGPWQRTDGVSFSHRLSDLTSTFDVLHPPMLDENGDRVAGGSLGIFTGTAPDGTVDTALGEGTCNEWLSASGALATWSGSADFGAVGWTHYSGWDCDQQLHLLCLDPGTGAALPAGGSSPGHWVFVTSAAGTGDLGSWSEAGGATGIAAGDAICRHFAAVGHLPAAETYLAWLSVAGAPAIDRITSDGPFRRPGGVEIAASKSDLVAGTYLESDIETDELREHINEYVSTGTDPFGQATNLDCNSWTSASSGDVSATGLSSASSNYWTTGQPGDCSSAHHLICISNVIVLFADGFESGDTAQWSSTTP